VEDALEARRRTIFAIEESSDVTQAVLGDMVPKLDGAVERLVTIAEKRESAARAVQNPKTSTDLENLKEKLRAADVEISDALDQLSTLRARVVRTSTESETAAQEAAAKLNVDLDELNLRLEALRSATFPPDNR